jgi:tetratricopeptide (TPR) repeat protein
MSTVLETKHRELEGKPSREMLKTQAQTLLPRKMGLLNGLSRENFRGKKATELRFILNLTKVSLHFIEKGEYKRAIACFDKILQIDPKCHQAWNNKGVCYLRMGDDATARECFDESIKLDQNYKLAWINKSLLDYKAMIKNDDLGDALVKLAMS